MLSFLFLKRVAEVTDSWWHSMLILPPLFKDSPATPFLTAYYPDCVGMSPSGSSSNMSLGELRVDHCRAAQPQSKSEFRKNAIFIHLLFIMLCCTHNYCFVSPLEILIIIMSLSSRLVSILPALLPAKWVRKGSVCAAWYDGARWALWVSRVFPRSHYVSGST